MPGLEVFDQELNQWIAIEQLIHEYAPKVNKYHSQYHFPYLLLSFLLSFFCPFFSLKAWKTSKWETKLM